MIYSDSDRIRPKVGLSTTMLLSEICHYDRVVCPTQSTRTVLYGRAVRSTEYAHGWYTRRLSMFTKVSESSIGRSRLRSPPRRLQCDQSHNEQDVTPAIATFTRDAPSVEQRTPKQGRGFRLDCRGPGPVIGSVRQGLVRLRGSSQLG